MAKGVKSQNDTAWEALFEKYSILDRVEQEGRFLISAGQIKEFREPRLMAKFDHRINLPAIFAENGLAILPVTRGEYLISHFDAYHCFEPARAAVKKAALPAYIQSLDAGGITSEAVALNCAAASGILADFLEEDGLLATVSGRMGSGDFSFFIRNLKTQEPMEVRVSHSQIEIDAALEGAGSLAVLEAKRDLSDDFLTRQLYYPFRVWSGRVSKKVRPVFLTYSNGIFSLYEYAFSDPNAYHSLELIKQQNYTIEEREISPADLLELAGRARICPEPEVAFPQADHFPRVINLCELLFSRELTREEVTQNYAFDIRQTNYYTDAARYLGLLEKRREEKGTVYALSALGKSIMRLDYKKRQLALCARILEHRVFLEAFKRYTAPEAGPKREEIVEIMRRAGLYRVASENTYRRRASTVAGWISWMLSLAQDQRQTSLWNMP